VQAHAEPGAHQIAVDEAFELLYRSYARDVYRYSLAVLRNPADAEDITQTTFLNAYRAYQRGEEPHRPRNWLITIAHNACRSRHLRAVRRPQEVPFEEAIAAMPAPAEETPKLEELLEALGRLPFNQRAALVMRELEGRSYAEIAETLELSVAAVETLIFRARRAVRRDRSLLGVLGSVQLPPSLGSFFGGGGGAGAVAGGGVAVGSGLLVKAAIVVAAGVVAGAVGPIVGAKVTQHRTPAAMALSPLTLRSSPGAEVVTSAAAMRVLRGPMVVVKRQGRTFVVTEGAVQTGAAVPFESGEIEVGGGPAPGAAQPIGATMVEGTLGPVTSTSASGGAPAALPSTGSATQTVTTTATSAVSEVTQTVSSVTSTAGLPQVSTPPLPTSTVAAPPPPPLPVDTSPVTSALPPIPTVTLPSLP
jgi:RNA polymerase sigma factor (sigma-70 family)